MMPLCPGLFEVFTEVCRSKKSLTYERQYHQSRLKYVAPFFVKKNPWSYAYPITQGIKNPLLVTFHLTKLISKALLI